MATTMYYIANCIKRILAAECSNRHANRRADDIAEAIRIANNESIEDAHKYLMRLCDAAEAGNYSDKVIA
jgi:hypothetical protein